MHRCGTTGQAHRVVAPVQDALCLQAVEVLREWDGLCAAESVGALLYERWRREYLAGAAVSWEVEFDLGDPIETPRGIAAEGAPAAVAALATVARQMVEEDGQPLDLPWGEYKRLPLDVNNVAWGLSGSNGESVRTSGGEAARPPEPGSTSTGVAGGTFKSVRPASPPHRDVALSG